MHKVNDRDPVSTPPARLAWRLLGLIRPYRWRFGAAVAATLALGALEPVVAALIEPLLDGSFVRRDPWFIQWMPLLLAGVFLLRGGLDFFATVGLKSVANAVIADLRGAMFRSLLQLPHATLRSASAGEWQSRFTYEVNQMGFAATTALVTLGRDGMAVIGLALYALWVHPLLTSAILVTLPVVAAVMAWSSRRLRRISGRLQGRMGEFNTLVYQAISGDQVIKTYNAQDFAWRQFATRNAAICADHQRLTRETEWAAPMVQGLVVIALAGVIGIAAQEAAAERLTIGQFASLMAALSLMLAPIKRLARLNEVVQRALAAATSVFALLDLPQETLEVAADKSPPTPPTGVTTAPARRGDLQFDAVTVRYRADGPVALQSFCFTAQPGMQVALVGTSGAGKTTVLQLIPRLLAPTAGVIRYDGVDIRRYGLAAWRQRCSYSGQVPVIWQATVWDNLALGRPVTVPQMTAACEAAGVLGVVTALPRGWHTVIGDGGVGLSGGQLSRLALARALLHEGPLLLLDEPTAALDRHAEQHLQDHLQRLRGDRLVWLVAHRLTTVRQADVILVLHQGQVVEQGQHADLLALGGHYAGLWQPAAAAHHAPSPDAAPGP